MDDPFSGEFANAPYEQVFARMDPAVTLVLTRMETLATSIEDLTADTLQAVIEIQDQAPHEVAVHLLLAGTAAIMTAHRPSFKTLGEHMRTTVKATATAWGRFEATGKWSTPLKLAPSATKIPTLSIELATDRTLNATEKIDPRHTDDVLDRVRSIGDRFADTARSTFIAMVRNELPVGELADAIDTTMVEHTRIAADLTATLRHNLHQLASTIEASYQNHRNTGLWRAPTVTMSGPATGVPGPRIQHEAAGSR